MRTVAFTEVGERVYVLRQPMFDVNVTLVVGDGEALVVDTLSTGDQATDLLAAIRAITPDPLTLVNTHAHFDHCFGNAAFDGPFWGHLDLPGYLDREAWRTLAEDDPDWALQVEGTPVTAPSRLVRDTALIDLGDRIVELHHLGRGHTGHDLLVRVPDCGLVFAGDLVEEAGPPCYGSDSFPLDWPITLTRLLGLEPDLVVPGHGDPVGARFVERQRDAIASVALGIRETYDAGLDPLKALRSWDWPYDPALLLHAVRRGHLQLAASG